MSAANCTVRGTAAREPGQRGIGAVRLRLTAPYAGSFALTGVEIKVSGSVERKDFAALRTLQRELPERFQRGIVFYCGREVVPFAADLHAVPLSFWWTP